MPSSRQNPSIVTPPSCRTPSSKPPQPLPPPPNLRHIKTTRHRPPPATLKEKNQSISQPNRAVNPGSGGRLLELYANLSELAWGKYEIDRQPQHLSDAYKWLKLARTLGEDKRDSLSYPRMRLELQRSLHRVYDLLIDTCHELIYTGSADAELPMEIFEVAEKSRSRRLNELLADEDSEPSNTPVAIVEKFRGLRRFLFQKLDEILHYEGSASGQMSRERTEVFGRRATAPANDEAFHRRVSELRDQVEMAQEEYDKCLGDIRRYDPEFDVDFTANTTTAKGIQGLIPDDVTAAIQFTLTEKSGYAIILTSDTIIPVRLPECTSSRVLKLADDWASQIQELPRTIDAMVWNEKLEATLAELSSLVVRRLARRIPDGIEKLILAPHQALHVFPLHACSLDNQTRLCDRFEVQVTPSFSILRRCANRRHESAGQQLLMIDIETPDLAFQELESARVRSYFDNRTTVVVDAAQDVQHITKQAGHPKVLHYTGHAFFDYERPLNSALKLGNDPKYWLTLKEVFFRANLPKARLVTLSACGSGMQKPDVLDEHVGFPTGFLFSGAKAVINSLWPVHELPTILLMDRFYANWRSGLSIGAALHSAQTMASRAIRSPRCLARVWKSYVRVYVEFGLAQLLSRRNYSNSSRE